MNPSRALFALCLTGCLSGGGDGVSAPQPLPGKPEAAIPYRIEGAHLLILPTLDTLNECDYDSLVRIVDTLRGNSFGYTLTPSAMTIAASRSLSSSGTIVEDLTLLQRIGPGTGVQGLWRLINVDYRVVSGTPDAEEQSELDGRLEDRRWDFAFEEDEYEFTPTVIISYRDKRTAALAMARWNGQGPLGPTSPESLAYAMDARAIDKYTVEYKGRVTGETVRVTTQANGDADYSSSDTSHLSMHYSENSATCPHLSWPDWYETFRNANSKSGIPAPKASAIGPGGPLFPNPGARSSKTKQSWMYP